LEGTENRIAISRRDFNEAVRVYNTDLHTFPGVIWAGTLYRSEKPMQMFEAAADAQAAPKVSFPAPTNQ
jgi:LemA protein